MCNHDDLCGFREYSPSGLFCDSESRYAIGASLFTFVIFMLPFISYSYRSAEIFFQGMASSLLVVITYWELCLEESSGNRASSLAENSL